MARPFTPEDYEHLYGQEPLADVNLINQDEENESAAVSLPADSVVLLGQSECCMIKASSGPKPAPKDLALHSKATHLSCLLLSPALVNLSWQLHAVRRPTAHVQRDACHSTHLHGMRDGTLMQLARGGD
jgi:hypothetical protein